MDIFINAAGGKDAPIVCMPWADGRSKDDIFFINAKYMMDLGATNVTVLNTNDRKKADSKEFLKPFENAKGV